MRHATRRRRLNRPLTRRTSLLRHLVSGLVLHERITTTFARARETQRLADRLVTHGKAGGLAARREVFDVLQDRTLTKRLFADVAPLFQDRQGGYTRVVRLQRRRGDGAQLALLEFVQHTTKAQTPAAPKPKKAKTATRPAESAGAGQAPAAPPSAETSAASSPTPAKPSQPDKRKGFLQGLRDVWRRKKTDE